MPRRRLFVARASPASHERDCVQVAPLLLVVEDDQNAKDGLVELLLAHGFRVSDAKDGAEALLKIETYRPDAVLLDLALPRMDGWTLTRRLRSDEHLRGVPVIAMSWLDYPDEVERAFEAGCDAFLAKPLDLRRLLPVIEKVIGRREPPPGAHAGS